MLRVIVQCRMSSTRLPSKAVRPIAGMPSVLLCLRRASNTGISVVMATSDDPSDDSLVELVRENKFPVYRGPLEDVLKRYVLASADLNDEDILVRLTADNMLPDGDFIEDLLRQMKTSPQCYLCSSSLLPYGLAAECFTVGILRKAEKNATSSYDREHVTPWILRQSERLSGNIPAGIDRSHLRCTLDTAEDYERLSELFEGVTDPIKESAFKLVRKLELMGERKTTSKLVLGTVQLGTCYGAANRTGMPSEIQSKEILTSAVKRGVTLFDTARAYGEAETLIGTCWPKQWPSGIQIITKLDPLEGLSSNADVSEVATKVDQSLEQSCKELRVERLPVLLLHRPEHRLSHGGAIWKRLLFWQQQGKLGELGVSVNTPEEAIAALKESAVKHLQLPFNLLDQRWKRAMLPERLSERQDVTVYVRSIFLQGILISEPELWPKAAKKYSGVYVKKLNQLTEQFGRKSKADLCMAYVAAQPWVNYFLVGVETLEQLDENLCLARENPLSLADCEIIEGNFIGVDESVVMPSQWREK